MSFNRNNISSQQQEGFQENLNSFSRDSVEGNNIGQESILQGNEGNTRLNTGPNTDLNTGLNTRLNNGLNQGNTQLLNNGLPAANQFPYQQPHYVFQHSIPGPQQPQKDWISRPENVKTLADVVVYATFFIFGASIISLAFHFQEYGLYQGIFYPIAFLISLLGLYAIRVRDVKWVSAYFYAYLLLIVLALVKYILGLYIRTEEEKNDIFNECKSFNDRSDDNCRDFADRSIRSAILSSIIFILIMMYFASVVYKYLQQLKNPPPPFNENEFEMQPAILPPYHLNNGQPPIYYAAPAPIYYEKRPQPEGPAASIP